MFTTQIAEVEGAFLYELNRYNDNRGFFEEIYSPQHRCHDVSFNVVQTNVSCSKAGVLRGMHVVPFAKLCMCVKGKIFDVVADVRPDSPTYLNWYGVWLSPEEPKQLFVPAGCAHGFFSLKDESVLLYMQDGGYNPEVEWEVNYLDPKIGIEWPKAVNLFGHKPEYILSDKDKAAPMLESVGVGGDC